VLSLSSLSLDSPPSRQAFKDLVTSACRADVSLLASPRTRVQVQLWKFPGSQGSGSLPGAGLPRHTYL